MGFLDCFRSKASTYQPLPGDPYQCSNFEQTEVAVSKLRSERNLRYILAESAVFSASQWGLGRDKKHMKPLKTELEAAFLAGLKELNEKGAPTKSAYTEQPPSIDQSATTKQTPSIDQSAFTERPPSIDQSAINTPQTEPETAYSTLDTLEPENPFQSPQSKYCPMKRPTLPVKSSQPDPPPYRP
jgi:hypothetical protein